MANLCHYCGGRAGTRDHIVPRCLLRRPFVPIPGAANIVHACERCNQLKGWARAACSCIVCCVAWNKYGPWDLTIEVVDVRALALAEDALLMAGSSIELAVPA